MGGKFVRGCWLVIQLGAGAVVTFMAVGFSIMEPFPLTVLLLFGISATILWGVLYGAALIIEALVGRSKSTFF